MKPVRRVIRVVRASRHTPVLLKRAVVKAWNDRVLGLSAEAAFWQMLSLPSLFLALVATLGYVSRWFGAGTVDQVEVKIDSVLSRAFSDEVVQHIIGPTLKEVLTGNRADVISIGFVLALWAGSSATATFVNTITIAYGQRDLRGAVRSRLLALGMFLGSVALGVVLLPMLVLGPDLLQRAFPQGARATVRTVFDIGYYPVLVLLLLAGLTTFYRLAPPHRLPWHRGVPGAVLAGLVFLGGSAGLRGYIRFILDRNHAYGTLAAPIAALLFFFILALGVLLGAEFNAAIEQMKPSTPKPHPLLDPRNWQVFQAEHHGLHWPGHAGADRADNDRIDSNQTDSNRTESDRTDSDRTDSESADAGPTDSGPADTDPAKSESANSGPADSRPAGAPPTSLNANGHPNGNGSGRNGSAPASRSRRHGRSDRSA